MSAPHPRASDRLARTESTVADFEELRRHLLHTLQSTRDDGTRKQLELMLAGNLRTLAAMKSSLELLRAESARTPVPTPR